MHCVWGRVRDEFGAVEPHVDSAVTDDTQNAFKGDVEIVHVELIANKSGFASNGGAEQQRRVGEIGCIYK